MSQSHTGPVTGQSATSHDFGTATVPAPSSTPPVAPAQPSAPYASPSAQTAAVPTVTPSRSAERAGGGNNATPRGATPGAPAAPGPSRPGMPSVSRTRARGPRRARLQLRNVDPWTVLKFSCVLSIALFFLWLIVIGVLYGVLDAASVIGKINEAVTKINGPGSNPPITPSIVFGGAAIIGLINMVLFIALSTLGSIVYNLCADLVGGVEVTLSEG